MIPNHSVKAVQKTKENYYAKVMYLKKQTNKQTNKQTDRQTHPHLHPHPTQPHTHLPKYYTHTPLIPIMLFPILGVLPQCSLLPQCHLIHYIYSHNVPPVSAHPPTHTQHTRTHKRLRLRIRSFFCYSSYYMYDIQTSHYYTHDHICLIK